MGLLCHLPAELIFMDVNSGPPKKWDVDVVGLALVFAPELVLSSICHTASLLATQTMIQAGCHPVVCAAFTLPLFIQTVWLCQSAADVSLYYLYYDGIYLLTAPVVCFVLICSHFVDYFARMKAIRAGFLSTEGNARSVANVNLRLPIIELPAVSMSFSSRAQTGSVSSTELLQDMASSGIRTRVELAGSPEASEAGYETKRDIYRLTWRRLPLEVSLMLIKMISSA